MTIQLNTQIITAERDLHAAATAPEGQFVPSAHTTVRGLGARVIRSSAKFGLRLADRVDSGYRYA